MFDVQHSKRPENDRSQASPQESSKTKQSIYHTGDLTRVPLYTQVWGNLPPPWLRPGMPQQTPQEEEPLQRTTEPTQRKENTTGLPDTLKTGVEQLSGLSLDDVNVHYNSSEPSKLQALAYTQGTEIHVGPGQEKHLAHEAWHVVQQMRGRVKPTLQAKGVAINDDFELEKEADVMGARATVEPSLEAWLEQSQLVLDKVPSDRSDSRREKLHPFHPKEAADRQRHNPNPSPVPPVLQRTIWINGTKANKLAVDTYLKSKNAMIGTKSVAALVNDELYKEAVQSLLDDTGLNITIAGAWATLSALNSLTGAIEERMAKLAEPQLNEWKDSCGSYAAWKELELAGQHPTITRHGAQPEGGGRLIMYEVQWGPAVFGAKTFESWKLHIHYSGQGNNVNEITSAHFKTTKTHAAGNNKADLFNSTAKKFVFDRVSPLNLA